MRKEPAIVMQESLFKCGICGHACIVCAEKCAWCIYFLGFIETTFEVGDSDENGQVLPYIFCCKFGRGAKTGIGSFSGQPQISDGRRKCAFTF